MSKTPKAPDPVATAKADQAAKFKTQQESMANQFDQFGNSLVWTTEKDPVTGFTRSTSTQKMSPANQALYDTLMRTKQTAGTAGSQLLTAADYGKMPDFTTAANSLTSQLYNAHLSLVEPQYENLRNQLDTKLKNQGLLPGTTAYDQQMRQMLLSQGQTKNDFFVKDNQNAYNQAVQNYLRPMEVAGNLATMGAPSGVNFNQGAVKQSDTDWGGIINQGFQNQLAANKADPFSMNNMVNMGMQIAAMPMTGPTGFGSTVGGSLMKNMFGGGTGGGASP